jgi:TP901 family phage tail tape measure protein
MARDQIEVDLLLNAKKAEATIKQMNRELSKMGKTMGQAFSGAGGGAGNKVRALGTGLSKATVRADEFSKSLEASNARVIAFGASAGLIMNVDRALRAMVKTTIQVEKAMADVNVVMNVSNKQLDQFGKGMFKVAKETAQGFSTVAEASTELARQGLGMEKTLARTKDALILTRLTGMNAADAVKSLTAAVNSFSKEGATSAQVVNRMAKVDAQFAVSSEDLANAISRVGASAQSAGVSMNELMAITTAVQQRTARGGAVIGNAFKTIFTRIQRSEVQQKLENIGVATRNMNGEMLSGIQVLQNLANNFNNLTKSQQASTAESVAGVFQVNILKSALADLSQQNSAYAGALRAANTATDEAYRKNEKLNQTLDSLVNKTMANLVQAGSALGGNIFGPAISNVLNTVNSTIEAFSEGGKFESFGEGIGKNLVKGIGKFIGGPGLIIATAVFGKLALSLSKFATTAFKDIMGINTAVKQRAALEEIVVNTLASEPALLQKVKMGTLSVLDVEKQILATIKQQQAERAALKGYGGALAGSMYQRGTRVGSSGRAFTRGMGRMGRASGFVPNFANPNVERAAAAAGGYTAGAIKTMNQPGAGTMMYNSAETVKQFPGMSQKAIMPPKNSPAGAGYKSAFGAAHGFDPYAAEGFIPNFNKVKTRPATRKRGAAGRGTKEIVNLALTLPNKKNDVGIITQDSNTKTSPRIDATPLSFSQNAMSPKDGIPRLRRELKELEGKDGRVVGAANLEVKGVPIVPIFPFSDKNDKMARAAKAGSAFNYLESSLTKYATDLSKMMFQGTGKARKFNMDSLGRGTEGDLFEEGVRAAIGGAMNEDKNSFFDFNGNAYAKSELIGFFNERGATNLKSRSKIESKIGYEAARDGRIPNKMMNDDSVGLNYSTVLKEFEEQFNQKTGTRKGTKKGTSSKALGYVPNFSPLSSAISRERQAGVPASKIRVGSSPALRSSGNPSGLGVYNTIDEPRGLNQGISRSRSMGINPKSHGAAEGFVPNFVMGPLTKTLAGTLIKMGVGKKDAVNFAKSPLKSIGDSSVGGSIGFTAGMTALGGSDSLMGSMASYGMMGIGGGLPGMLGMAGVGALMHGFPKVIDHFTSSSKDASESLKEQIAAQKEANDAAKESVVAFGEVAESLSAAEFVTRKEQVIGDLSKAFPSMIGSKEYKDLLKADKGNFGQVSSAFTEQGEKVQAFQNVANISNFKGMVRPQSVGGGGMDDVLYGGEGNLKTVLGLESGAGKTAADELISKLEGTKYSPEGVIRDVVKRGNIPYAAQSADLKTSTASAAAAMGMSVKDYSTFRNPVETGLKELVKEEGGFEKRNAALTEFNNRIITLYTNGEILSKVQEEEAKRQKQINDQKGKESLAQSEYTDVIYKAMKAQAEYRDSVFQLQRQLDTFKRSSAQELAILGIEGNLRTGRAGATMTQAGAVGVSRDIAVERAEKISKDATEAAAKTLEIDIKSGLKDLDVVKFIEGQTLGAPEAKRALDIFTQARESINTGVDGKSATDDLLEQLASVKGLDLSDRVFQSSTEEGLKTFLASENLPSIIETLSKAYEKHQKATEASTETEINAKALAEKNYEVQLELLKLQRTINTVRRQEMREIQADIASAEFQEAKRLAATGQLGARGVGSAYEASVNAQIAAGGVRSVNFGGVMGQTFKNEMSYNEVDAFGDFRDGVKDVAGTMKSSFADAFQSISSGATTVQGALANMAQSILSSINQMSTQIFTNMMFSKMFGNNSPGNFAKGGYVPGYAAGGLVTGGSGYKDDVLTKMQGGEFVIKKSAVNRIGVGTLNAINGYANGGSTGPSMGTMGLVAGVSGAATGILGAAMQDRPDKPLPSRNYGMGRSSLGYLGGADPDGGQIDRASGGGTSANVSLSKGFVYYRRDPETGRLVSERARPTEGRFEVSSALSLMGRLDEGDPQTSRMFDKEQRIANYQNYIAGEKASRRAQIRAVKDQKKSRLIGAYMNAAMLIGGAKLFGGGAGTAGGEEMMGPPDHLAPQGKGIPYRSGYTPHAPGDIGFMENQDSLYANGGRTNGSLARVMGGEYVMSPQAVRTHGVDFMTELNRGNVPRYASGGLVGNQTGGVATGGSGSAMSGNMTNNVKINVNIDKSGKAEASATADSQSGSESAREESEDVQNNADLGKALQSVVLDELIKQQRPGGLLHSQS